MGKKSPGRPPAPATPPTIHEAELASGPSGAILKGPVIDLAAAVGRRKGGLDVVVCGNNLREYRNLARQIEAAAGPYRQQDPHKTAGPSALPHFQPDPRPPEGHTFYETANPQRKARLRP
jgi:hypothetical protein